MAKLTPWQAHWLYFCERDKNGSVVIPADDNRLSHEQVVRMYAKAIGLKPYLTDRLVADRLDSAANAVRDSRHMWKD